MTGTSDSGDRPYAIVPGTLYAIGDTVSVDGKLSWLRSTDRGTQPLNAYVIRDGTSALLIDTGVAAHRASILKQLDELLVGVTSLQIFLTRHELDCVGNVKAIAERFPQTKVYAGGSVDVHDGYEMAGMSDLAEIAYDFRLHRVPSGGDVLIGPGRSVRVLKAKMRLLDTYWIHDALTATLFTSDSFGYTVTSVDGADPDFHIPSRDLLAERLLTRFAWMSADDVSEIVEELRRVFSELNVINIAPTHGLVISGQVAVQAHHAALTAALPRV